MHIHWLDFNRLEGSASVTAIVDRSWDWNMRTHPRFEGCGFEQINLESQLLIEASDPFYELPQWDFSLNRSQISIVSQPTEFGTQLPESLFWCGWDQLGEFDCSGGWDGEYWRMGGWPNSLAHKPAWLSLVPVDAGQLDLRWFVTQHCSVVAPLAVGPRVSECYRELGLDYPSQLAIDDADIAVWHEAVWNFASEFSWHSYRHIWQQNLLVILDKVLSDNQLAAFAAAPTWARNTQRLIATLQRGQARFRHYRAWLADVV